MGLDSLPWCTVYILFFAFLWVLWFLQHGKNGNSIWGIMYMRFGLETRSRSHVVSWLVVAAWLWVVSVVPWSICAGRGVETAPQGWIYTLGFIIAGLYTIHAGEMIAWFEKVLADLKRAYLQLYSTGFWKFVFTIHLAILTLFSSEHWSFSYTLVIMYCLHPGNNFSFMLFFTESTLLYFWRTCPFYSKWN